MSTTQRTTLRLTRWRWAAWAIWGACVLAYIVLFIFTTHLNYDYQHATAVDLFEDVLPRLNMTPGMYAVYFNALNIVYFSLSVLMALLLFWKRPLDPMALLASLALLAAQSYIGRGVYAFLDVYPQWFFPIM